MLRLTPSQQRFVEDPSRVKLLVGRRGAGKTTAAIVALLKVVEPDKLYGACFVASRYQVGNLAWLAEDMFQELDLVKRELTLNNGAKIMWFGPTEFERVRDRFIEGLALDDADMYPEETLFDFMRLTTGPVIVTSFRPLEIEGASVTEFVSFLD